jgi:hypothetical protein
MADLEGAYYIYVSALIRSNFYFVNKRVMTRLIAIPQHEQVLAELLQLYAIAEFGVFAIKTVVTTNMAPIQIK